MIVRRIGPLSCAKITGTLYAILGLFFGAVFAAIGSLAPAFSSGSGGFGFAASMGAVAVVVVPICYGLLGFIGALIGASVYNVLAGIVGGIQLDME